ncbi:MAG: glycerophosphodiester phosphodiesterase family protein [Ignavibacteriales bacterium]|nr:glycerophosphodiester phosphodiesterase family protein [Ignavibacteriales bacterium]
MNWLTQTPIAHRGLHDNQTVPENSLLSFTKAIEKNYPIELDLQLLNDNSIAVFHDINLSRMTGEQGSIHKKNKNILSSLKLLNTQEKIPTVEEMLELVAGKVPLLIELKSRLLPGRFEENLLKILRKYKGQFAIESFNPLTVLWFKLNAPKILRGMLSRSIYRADLYTSFINANFLAVNIHHLPEKLILKKTKPIIGYTAKSKEEELNAKRICDNIIFEGFIP